MLLKLRLGHLNVLTELFLFMEVAMTYIIHGTDTLGGEDQIAIEADTIEELQQQAKEETEKRNWKDCWSEKVN